MDEEKKESTIKHYSKKISIAIDEIIKTVLIAFGAVSLFIYSAAELTFYSSCATGSELAYFPSQGGTVWVTFECPKPLSPE